MYKGNLVEKEINFSMNGAEKNCTFKWTHKKNEPQFKPHTTYQNILGWCKSNWSFCHFNSNGKHRVQWLTSVIPELWVAEAGGSPKVEVAVSRDCANNILPYLQQYPNPDLLYNMNVANLYFPNNREHKENKLFLRGNIFILAFS